MPDDDELARAVRKLTVNHAETRWLALRLDDDVKEVREELRVVHNTLDEHTGRFDAIDGRLAEHSAVLAEHSSILAEHTALLTEHSARFDSIDGQLRSLTQLVGQVLARLPEEPGDAGGD